MKGQPLLEGRLPSIVFNAVTGMSLLKLEFSLKIKELQPSIGILFFISDFQQPQINDFVSSTGRGCVRKLFLQKTSPQKLLTGFLQNFTGMFFTWSSFKFLQIVVFY